MSEFASATDRLIYQVSGQFRVVSEHSVILCCCSEQTCNLCSSVSDSKPASKSNKKEGPATRFPAPPGEADMHPASKKLLDNADSLLLDNADSDVHWFPISI